MIIIVLTGALLIVPLGNTYLRVVRSSQTETAVHQQVVNTLGPSSPLVVNHIDVNGKHVIIELSDVNGAPTATQFEADLVNELGQDVRVELH